MACGSPEKPGKEPNDSILKADPIKLDKAVKMKIDSNHDRDWFRTTIPDKGYLKIGAKDVPDGLKLEVKFAEKQPWQDQKHNWYTGWNRLPEATQFHERDTLYFAIQDNNRDAGSAEQFAIKAQFIKEFDEHELNNEAANAAKQPLGESIKSYFYPVGDKDWFQFKAAGEGYLWIKEKSAPDNVKSEAKFARRDDMTEELETLTHNNRVPCAVRIPEKGTYHVRLQDNNRDESSTDPVQWKVDYLKEMDTTEPNNETAKAHPASIGETIAIAIFPKEDRDYVKLKPKQQKEVFIKANSPDDIEAAVRLFKKTGMETKRMTSRKKLPHKTTFKGGETYFIEFRDYNDDNRYPKTFPVMVLENPES
jgi:hypothetical protein